MAFLLIPALRWMVIAMALVAVFAGASVRAQPVEASDARGITVHLQQPARRIITLAPNLTELVFAAGAGARLAGVARYSDHPPEARGLPVVSDAVQFDVERMLALRADLVLAWQGGTPPEAIARMERAGLKMFVAGAAGLDDIAFDTDLRALRARRSTGAPVRVFYEIWGRPLLTVNNAHLISEIIWLCGGINVFGDQRPLTPEVSREALLEARPDIVLGGSSADTPAAFSARWAALPPPLNVLPVRYLAPDLMQRPTPRILEGARQVCSYLDGVRAARR